MIENFPQEYEQKTGAQYGQVEGGVHYNNLNLISDPFDKYIRPAGGKIKCADFGGGSGIVGLYIKNFLEDKSIQTKIDIIDKNPKQLEGVSIEESKYGYQGESKIILADLFNLNIENVYDSGVMRMVLNYMTKEQIPLALNNVARAMRAGGVFINCAMVAFSQEQQIFYNNFRYPSSDRILFGGDYAKRYIPTVGEFLEMQEAAFGSCFVTGFVSLDQTSKNVQERFSFSRQQTDRMAGEWFKAPEKAKKELNLRIDSEGVVHYDWWNVVLTSIRF